LFRLSYVAAGLWSILFLTAPAVLLIAFVSLIYGSIKGITETYQMSFRVANLEPGTSSEPTTKLITKTIEENVEPRILNVVISAGFLLLFFIFASNIYHAVTRDAVTNFARSLFAATMLIPLALAVFYTDKVFAESSHKGSRWGRGLLTFLL